MVLYSQIFIKATIPNYCQTTQKHFTLITLYVIENLFVQYSKIVNTFIPFNLVNIFMDTDFLTATVLLRPLSNSYWIILFNTKIDGKKIGGIQNENISCGCCVSVSAPTFDGRRLLIYSSNSPPLSLLLL